MMSTRRSAPPVSLLIKPENGSLTPGSARSLLVTILGELVWPTRRPVWTSALVYILKGLGIEEQTARQAIARAAASDWIIPTRRGREVCWSLSPKLLHIFDSGSPRVYSLSDPFSSWDGSWLSVLTNIPHSHRNSRRPLYAGLTWAGFGNPAPGLWLSPHVERADEVAALIGELGLEQHMIGFVGTVKSLGISESDIVAKGWDLQALSEHYEQLLAAMADLRPGGGDETLFAHVRMVSEWQELPRTDPQLPEALLPDWIGRRAARRIEVLRAQWTPTVRARFDEINAGVPTT
ncbi:PaaX family transcriptional regulator C-terminal domain-containing protein [Kribbella alba]|uniref:PaaX family transcriptional regulator C-terminal domain-containing protein n=1 Tax=Kribbella alba TaxID=190197 RepID=A0ABN2FGA3_9ACTN